MEILEDNEDVDSCPDREAGLIMEEENISLLKDMSEVEMNILNKLSSSSAQDIMDSVNKRSR